MNEALLEVSRLNAGYGGMPVLRDIGIVVRAAEIVAMVGSNGAGKTTMLRAISRLIDARGEIRFGGRDLGRATADEVFSLGLVQVPEGRQLFDRMSVEENLLMGAYLRGSDPKSVAHDLERVYAIFPKLKERRRQAAGTMSGGEQQMCAVGRGLMSAPRLLMIDELSLGLSPLLVEQLVEALIALNREGLTILVVEQDVVAALEVSRTAYVMDTGRVTQHGESAALLADPAVRRAYLGALAH